jgi:hypothetical protein
VAGTKSFSYFMIPKEPGTYNLSNYFEWVFFNPETKKYDTLKSQQTVNVIGESQQNQAISSNDLGSFYDRIDATDNSLKSISSEGWMKWSVNILLVLILGGVGYIALKK